MNLPVLSLRLRVFLFFALLALAPPALTMMAIWLSGSAPEGERLRLLGTYTAVGAILCALVTLLVWQLFDRYIAGALQSLARQMQTALHSDSPQLADEEQWCYLGPVSDAAGELIEELHQLRSQRRVGTVEDSHDEARYLAGIIRDLETGVLVMNLDFDILLYNRHALHLLSGLVPDCAHALGLGRSATTLIPRHTLEQLAREIQMKADLTANGQIGAMALQVRTPDGRQTIQARMHMARHPSGEANGYVLILDTPAGSPANSQVRVEEYDTDAITRSNCDDVSPSGDILPQDNRTGLYESTTGALLAVESAGPAGDRARPADEIILPERPEFYDFDLFDRRLPADLSQVPLQQLDFVVFDTETTGLEPSSGDEIISIAAVRIVNGRVMQGELFDELVDPGRPIPPGSTTFHGITDDMVKGKPGINAVLPRFERFVSQSILVAHNAAFDMKFLELKSTQCNVHFDNPVLDTVLLSAWLHDHSQRHTLDDLAERYGIGIENRHSALGDAMATAQVFVRILKQLASRDVRTLKEAIVVSERMTHIKRAQKAY